MAGKTKWGIGANTDAWMIKIDAQGNEVWSRTIDKEPYDEAKSVQLTFDGCYIVAGMSSVSSHTYSVESRYWLLKTDGEGNEIWYRTFGGPDDRIASVLPSSDGSYILAGYSWSNCTWLIKTDAKA